MGKQKKQNIEISMYVEFKMLRAPSHDGNTLREFIEIADLIPVPPQELHKFFKTGDVVEAFCGINPVRMGEYGSEYACEYGVWVWGEYG